MRLGGDRLVGLAGILAAHSLGYSVIKTGTARHLIVRAGKGRPHLVLVAHYDRVPGSVGALDNSCACIQLAAFAARASAFGPCPPLLFAFTDEEEAPGSGEASTQGSFALARALTSAFARQNSRAGGPELGTIAGDLAAIVLDVTGRGERLLLSTASASLLARNGLSGSAAAEGQRALAVLARRAAARAKLPPPVDAAMPWSDDLGLTLGGLPSLTVSLLPEIEIPFLSAGERPPTWKLLHTSEDRPKLAEEGAFETMAAFLDALLLELVAPA
jgi:Zn-dependent M28 family amino/carboxypeptidase